MTETPFLRVVRGAPSAEELAVVVALLSRRPAAPPGPRPRSAWADPARRIGPAGRPGPGAWRRSALPR